MWTREQAQNRADVLRCHLAYENERAVRLVAAELVAERFDEGLVRRGVVQSVVTPLRLHGGWIEAHVAFPASWGRDLLVLQLVIEEQLREAVAATVKEAM